MRKQTREVIVERKPVPGKGALEQGGIEKITVDAPSERRVKLRPVPDAIDPKKDFKGAVVQAMEQQAIERARQAALDAKWDQPDQSGPEQKAA